MQPISNEVPPKQPELKSKLWALSQYTSANVGSNADFISGFVKTMPSANGTETVEPAANFVIATTVMTAAARLVDAIVAATACPITVAVAVTTATVAVTDDQRRDRDRSRDRNRSRSGSRQGDFFEDSQVH